MYSPVPRYAGQVGYVIANIKNIKDAMVGDTLYHPDKPVEPMPGFKPAKPMVTNNTHFSFCTQWFWWKQEDRVKKESWNSKKMNFNGD